MEKAILKTLAYADIFDYPMKAWEIHKWLINRKASLPVLEKTLNRLIKKGNIKNVKGYYFLKGRSGLVEKRIRRERQSKIYSKQVGIISQFLKLIPWVKLVGVSGNLAVENAEKKDDIDLFIITEKGRLWISRILLLGILELSGKRRKRIDTIANSAGKLCINLLLEEDNLAQQNKNIYLAHEVLQMKVLWQRGDIYSRFLETNDWAFKFLPNWIATQLRGPVSSVSRRPSSLHSHYAAGGRQEPSSLPPLRMLVNLLEEICQWLQKRYMGKPSGKEKISEGALYFHPNDYQDEILKKYQKAIKRLA